MIYYAINAKPMIILYLRTQLTVHQRQDVAYDDALCVGRLFCTGTGEEAAGVVEGGEVEGVGGELDIGDDAAGLVDGEGELYPTPVELGGVLGCEGAPATIFPFGRSEVVVEGTDLGALDYFGEIGMFGIFRVFGIFGKKCFLESWCNALGGNRGVEFGEVHHTAAHRLHAVLLQLGGLGLEVVCQVGHVATDEQRAMVQVVDAALGKSISGKLTTFGQDIVAAGEFCVEAEAFHSALDDGELALLVVEGLGDDEGEVEVAIVVVDGAAAGLAAHEEATVGLKGLDVDLAVGVLVLSDDYGAAVTPKVQRHTFGRFNKKIFDGDVPIGFRLVRNNKLQFH